MKPQSQNFQSLRRLLALKRYEKPPPGFFDDFSTRVVARIRSGERVDQGFFEQLYSAAGWLQPFLSIFETRPILVGAFGSAVCLLIVSGIVYSDNRPEPSNDVMAIRQPETEFPFAVSPTMAVSQPMDDTTSTSNSVAPVRALFDEAESGQPSTQPVNLLVPANP